MRYLRNRLILELGLIISFSVILLTVVACDRSYALTIENQTDQILTIHLESGPIFIPVFTEDDNVAPGTQIVLDGLSRVSKQYRIEARNSQGKLIYSKVHTLRGLDEAGWRVVIKPTNNS